MQFQDERLFAAKVEDESLQTTVRSFICGMMSKSLALTYSWSRMGLQRRKNQKGFQASRHICYAST